MFSNNYARDSTQNLMQQAAAVAEFFLDTKFDTIYASPLLRANATAQAIHSRQQAPFPSFIVTPNIREQHFGVAEGTSFAYIPTEHDTLDELFAQGIYPVLYHRDEKFPGAESLNDLALRAEKAIMECVIPHLQSEEDAHIAMVSHGLCISELVAALLRLDPDSRRDTSYKGLLNTAWTRATVSIKVCRMLISYQTDVLILCSGGRKFLRGSSTSRCPGHPCQCGRPSG